jgi:outer membrane lipoprotein carrier protein
MKRLMFAWVAMIAAMPLILHAQQPVSGAESAQMVAQVCAAAKQIHSLQCDFVQEKHLSLLKTSMTSKGKMFYKGGKLLRWEYTAPYTYTFVINGETVIMQSQQQTHVVDVKSSKMFQQIARIMMNSITGQSLSDGKDFQVTMYTDNGRWIASLKPQQKEMAQLFSAVRLYIDPVSQMVTSVELVEKGGDTSVITMEHIEKNKSIDDSVFNVR